MDSDKEISTNMTMALVANAQFLGGGFNAAQKAKMSDGLLDVVILKDSGSLKVFEKLVKLKRDGDYNDEDNILYYQARQVAFIPKEKNITVSLDGEPVGILPATFRAYHNALSIKC